MCIRDREYEVLKIVLLKCFLKQTYLELQFQGRKKPNQNTRTLQSWDKN